MVAFLSKRIADLPHHCRFLLIAGGSIQTAALMTMGGLGSVQNPSRGVTSAVIAMMIIFTAGYSFGWVRISTPGTQLRSSITADPNGARPQ